MNFSIPEVQDQFDEYELSRESTIESLSVHYRQIKAGRANPYVLDAVRVDYYGVPTPINQLGNIAIHDAKVLQINVWDASALKLVEKAILAANIGLTPNNDGKCIRLIFPDLTEERRIQLSKQVRVEAENARIAMRNHRRKIIEVLKKMKKDSDITEDDLDLFLKEVDKLLNEAIDQVDKIAKDKEKEIMTV